MSINQDYYRESKSRMWTGRVDSDSDFKQFRYHQVARCVSLLDLDDTPEVALLGFASDEGVRRNKGRVGAAEGPVYFRDNIGSMCWHGAESGFIDVGKIIPKKGNLEEAQQELGKAVQLLLQHQKKPFIIGGGHETAYGHYLGIAQFLKETEPDAKLGILNVDAHFDLRPYDGVPHSGSPFLQAHEHAKENELDLKYFVYGINPDNNTSSLFETADALGARHCTNREIWDAESEALNEVQQFIESRTHIYLTICLDVFKAEIAPGVSAQAWHGIELTHALKVFDLVKKTNKLISMDVCELNPTYDENQKTAKLAGSLFSERVG
ncbi:MAG: formimidoylglutamase [Balneolaceae bacterium]